MISLAKILQGQVSYMEVQCAPFTCPVLQERFSSAQTSGQESNATHDPLHSGGRESPSLTRHAILRSFTFLLDIPNGLAFHILERVVF